MENGQKTMFDLFGGEKHFIIPRYQRAYAWEYKQIRDFLEDINNQRRGKQYFLGTILFQDNKDIRDGFEQIYIVDGQQRMTTVVIFMKVLLNILEKKDNEKDYSREKRRYLKDKDVYKLEIVHTDNEFFKTYIIDDNRFDGKNFITPSQKRLYAAKDFFEKELKKLDSNVLKGYMEKIERSRILSYSVDDIAEATLIFETTNDRGKPLTNLEKTKSFLMHKIYLTKHNPHELIESIQDRFSEIYRILEEIESDIEGEDNILQYHFISHFDWKYTQKKKDYQDYVKKLKEKINNMMKNEKYTEVAQFIDNYSRELKETFSVVKDIINDKNKKIRDMFILERISTFYPILIKCYKLDKSYEKKDYYDVVRLLEIFSFRVYGIGNKPAYTSRDKLYTLARDFKGDFNKIKVEIKSEILDKVDMRSFKEKLSSYYLYKDTGLSDLRYLFWKYENYLRINEQPKAAEMSEEEFLTKIPKLKLEIEHIASQNPKVTTSDLKLPDIDEDFQENFLHRLGNLTFDPKSANASKGNQDIEMKNSKYFVKAPFKIQNELDDFIFKNRWTKESIIKRGQKITNFVLNYWDPTKIETEEVEEKNITDGKVSNLKYKHRKLFKEINKPLRVKFGQWNVSSNAKIKKNFNLSQSRDGYRTFFKVKWYIENVKFYIEGGMEKDEEDPWTYFIQFYTVNKSDKIIFNLKKPEIQDFLRRERYENETNWESRPYYRKELNIESANEEKLKELFIKEMEKLKPIIEKILS